MELKRMKRTLLTILLFTACTLTGCYNKLAPEIKRPEYVHDWYTEDKAKEFKYTLTNYDHANLYNNGLAKEVLTSDRGQSITIIAPRFHSTLKLSTNSMTIASSENPFDSKGKLTEKYIRHDIALLTDTSSISLEHSNFYRKMLNNKKTREDYPSKKFKTYEEYVSDYEAKINEKFINIRRETNLTIKGMEFPVRGHSVDTLYNDIKLPTSTYYFTLPNGDVLHLSVEYLMPEYSDVLTASYYDKTDKQLSKLKDVDLDFDAIVSDIINTSICGDYSNFFNSTEVSTIGSNQIEEAKIESNFVEVKDSEPISDTTTNKDTVKIEEIHEYEYSHDVQFYFNED